MATDSADEGSVQLTSAGEGVVVCMEGAAVFGVGAVVLELLEAGGCG